MSISAFLLQTQRLVPLENDATSPDELTRRLPRGLYTTFSTNHNGTRVLGLAAHLDRLYAPPQAGGTHPSASRADLRLAIAKLAADYAPSESRFRLLVSASDGMAYIIVQPFTPPAREIYEHGVNTISAALVRHDPRLKDTSFITESQSVRTKVGGDVFEVLLTKNGRIYEGMTSNFYAILPSRPSTAGVPSAQDSAPGAIPKGHRHGALLITARTGILHGVTRRAVLRLARGQGLDIHYRAPRLNEDFVEAFLTSSSRGIVPIVSIDSRRVGEGTVGRWTQRLMSAYRAYVAERSEKIAE